MLTNFSGAYAPLGAASSGGASDREMTSCASPTTSYNQAITQATNAKAAGVTVYTIGLGPYVLGFALTNIAAAGGGTYYPAPTPADPDPAISPKGSRQTQELSLWKLYPLPDGRHSRAARLVSRAWVHTRLPGCTRCHCAAA